MTNGAGTETAPGIHGQLSEPKRQSILGSIFGDDREARSIGLMGLGIGLSQLGSGQPVNLSGPMQMLHDRQSRAEQRRMLEESGITRRFTKEQQAIIAMMPPHAAMQVLAQEAFRPKPKAAQVKLSTFKGPDGTVYSFNPVTGQTNALTGAEAAEPGYRMLSAQEAAQAGLGEGAFQMSPDGKISKVGGSLVSVNMDTGGPQLPKPPDDYVWARDESGNPIFEDYDTGNGVMARRPIPIPLRGTDAEQTSMEIASQQNSAVDAAQNMLSVIDGISGHDALDNATGVLSFTQSIPGTQAYDLGTRVNQLQGQIFTQAFEALKGGGAISEIEGLKAEQAVARINSGLSPNDFRVALDELKAIVLKGYERAARQGGVSVPDLTDQQLLEMYGG